MKIANSAADALSMIVDSLPISSNILAIVSGGISATRFVGILTTLTLTFFRSSQTDIRIQIEFGESGSVIVDQDQRK